MAVVPEEEEQPAATWSQKLQDPVVRSAMLSMGLQLMTGGWGNATQQLAAGIGAGAAGAEGTAKALQAQAKDERDHDWEVEKQGASQANQAANRKQSETNARIAADSRAEVANIRGEFSMQRAALAAGAKNNNETKQWQADRDAYLKQARSNINNMTKDEKELISSADEYATSKMHARRLEGGAGGSTTKPTPQATPGPQTSTTPAAAETKATPGNKVKSWEEAMQKESFRNQIMTEAGRAAIARVRPDLKKQLDQFGAQRKLRGEK